MMPRYLGVYLFLISSFFLSFTAHSQEFDAALLKEAYFDLFHLNYEEVENKKELLSQTETGKILSLHLDNYKDFLRIFSTDDRALYDQFRSNKATRLAALERLNKENPYYAFVRAEIILQWAVVDARFKKYIAAYRAVVTSYSLLEENLENYPDFLLSRKSLAICHALVGAIPEKYRWGFQLISRLEGTIEQGLRELEEVISWATDMDLPYREEAVVAKTYILLHLANEPERAKSCLLNSTLDPLKSPVACFIHANLALKMGDARNALQVLNRYLNIKGSYELPYLYFLRGLARIQHLEADAHVDFEEFIRKNQGTNYVKEAHQKIAWSYLLQGNELEYDRQMKLLLTKGSLDVGGDQNAQKEAEKATPPNMALLKARLLFDGGICDRAKEYLDGLDLSHFPSLEEKVEFIYRRGRVAQCNKDDISAIIFFIQCIELGGKISSYFPCNAALQLGMIFEELDNVEEARMYYRKCLSFDPDDYGKALHAKASAGLKRLEGR